MHTITSSSPLQGVMFDFGSTLAISSRPWSALIPDGAAALTGLLRGAGLDLPPDFADTWVAMLRFSIQSAERDGIERPADDVLALVLASQGCDAPDRGLIRRAMDAYFMVEDAARTPAPGAVSLLRELKAAGYRLALISNTIGGRWVQYWTDQYGFRPYLDAVVTSDEIGIRKPRPEIFAAGLARMGLTDPAAVVMVGDTLHHDVLGAKALGMRAVQISLAEDQSLNSRPQHPARTAEAGLPGPVPAEPDARITELPALIPILERWQADAG